MKEAHVYTVTELTRNIRFILEDHFEEVWVEGEISNYKTYPSGHSYFSLKDKDSILTCVLFKNDSSGITFPIQDGLSVLCFGKISVYEKRGQYQLYVTKLEPKGKGALQLAFEALKKKLYEEGLFDESRKKPLPVLPICVGLVTSPEGAAIRDILKIAKRRYSNIEILLRPVRVQGTEAKYDIVEAIKELNEFSQTHPIDVIILARGGGSLEDLWSFNEEIVARAIFSSKIPIVSAIGHEVDYTISDFVADLRAPTPSAAAELVIPLKQDFVNRISEYRKRLYTLARNRILAIEKQVRTLCSSYILRTPINFFLQKSEEVDDLTKQARTHMVHFLKLKEHSLMALNGKLSTLSPLSILKRGYSITFKDGEIITNSKFLRIGDLVRTQFAEGEIASRVEKGSGPSSRLSNCRA